MPTWLKYYIEDFNISKLKYLVFNLGTNVLVNHIAAIAIFKYSAPELYRFYTYRSQSNVGQVITQNIAQSLCQRNLALLYPCVSRLCHTLHQTSVPEYLQFLEGSETVSLKVSGKGSQDSIPWRQLVGIVKLKLTRNSKRQPVPITHCISMVNTHTSITTTQLTYYLDESSPPSIAKQSQQPKSLFAYCSTSQHQKKVSSENQTSNPNLNFPPCHIHHFPVSFPMFFRPLVRTSGPPGPPVKVGAWIRILLCKRELGKAQFLASGFTQHVRFTRSNWWNPNFFWVLRCSKFQTSAGAAPAPEAPEAPDAREPRVEAAAGAGEAAGASQQSLSWQQLTAEK